MQEKYPDQWLLITDFTLDGSGCLQSGCVERHSSDRRQVYRLPAINKPAAFRYTGQSSYKGTRQYGLQCRQAV